MSIFEPKKGDLALFDGWTIWPFDPKDPVAALTLRLSGVRPYRWDGKAWVKYVGSSDPATDQATTGDLSKREEGQ